MISPASPAASSLRVTKAFGRSPQCGCGIPTTAHSSTAGWAAIACSTSMLEMFSPPEMMMSLPRSRSSMLPSGCHTARSPEWNPPAGDRFAGGGFVVEVAAHDVVPAHDDLAHRGPVPWDVGHLPVDDAD